MPREISVENYLVREMAKIGIRADKYKTPGRRHAPDRICLTSFGNVFFVECKAPGEKARPGQIREHQRLRARHFRVFVTDTKAAVDKLIGRINCDW